MVKKEGPILKIHNLCKNFGGIRAVDELSFDVKRGDIHYTQTGKHLISADAVGDGAG